MNVCVLLVPYDSGRYRERMGRGPHHLYEQALAPMLAGSGHTVRVRELTIPDTFTGEIKTAFAVCRAVAEQVGECLRDGWFPLVLSGNCNAAVGTVSGCGCAGTSVVWFDAHGEATTPETTTSGFLDGMGISILTGRCWQTLAGTIPGFEPMPGGRILLVGSRDLEPAEDALLKEVGVRRIGAAGPWPLNPTYLHFDLDVLDPAEAIWNQWSPPGGETVGSVVNAVKELRRRAPVKAAGIASYDPEADRDGRGARAAAAIVEALLAE
jgi:arginase